MEQDKITPAPKDHVLMEDSIKESPEPCDKVKSILGNETKRYVR